MGSLFEIGWKAVRAGAARAGHRLGIGRRKRLVLTYHRVVNSSFDPFGLCVPPDWFAGHLEHLCRRARIVPLSDLLADPGRGRRPKVSVTLDDGYEDLLAAAVPILRSAKVPATAFVPTGYLGDPRGYWWDRLAAAVAASDAPVSPRSGPLPPTSVPAHPETRAERVFRVAAALRVLDPDSRDTLVAEIEASLPIRPGGTREPHRILDADGVRALADDPRVEIGAHTDRHAWLAGSSREEQSRQIVRGLDELERITGRRPSLLAYPYGEPRDYNDDTCAAAAAAGLRAAFVNHPGRFDAIADPYRLPRFPVPPMSPDSFAGFLDRILSP